MSNGDAPRPEDDLTGWAQAFRSQQFEKWHAQEGANKRQELWNRAHEVTMSAIETRVQKTENRSAVINTVSMVIGGIICAAIPILIELFKG